MRKNNVGGQRLLSSIFCIFIIYSCITACFQFTSASSATMRKVADIYDGVVYDVFIVEDTAYVACGSGGLKLYDVSNQSSPLFLAELDEIGQITSVFVRGDYAYIAAGEEGLIIIDVSDIDDLDIIGSYSIPNSDGFATEVDIEGNHAFVAYEEDGLNIFDISNPSNPRFTSSYDFVDVDVTDVQVNQTYVYIINNYYDNPRIEVIDISNIYYPTSIGSYSDGFGYPSDIWVAGDVVLVADNEDGLEILNVTDPHHPREIGNFTVGYTTAVCGNETHAFISTYSGVKILDITDPTNPLQIGSAGGGHYGDEMFLSENFIYVMGENSRRTSIFNISNPASPSLIGSIDDEMGVWDITIQENTAFIAGDDGIVSINITDPTNPSYIDEFSNTGCYIIASSPGYCYSDILNNFHVIDGTSMIDVASINTENYISKIITDDSLAVVLSEYGDNYYYAIIDISDPINPIKLSQVHIEREYFWFQDLAIEDNVLYLLGTEYDEEYYDLEGVLYTIDITDPSHPAEITQYSMKFSNSICVVSNYAYITTSMDGLQILDVSIPGNPQLVAEFDVPLTVNPYGYMEKILVFNDFAFVGIFDGIIVLDVYDKENIEFVEFYEDEYIWDMEFYGNYLYYTTESDGMEIVEVKLEPTNRNKIPGYPLYIIGIIGICIVVSLLKEMKKNILCNS